MWITLLMIGYIQSGNKNNVECSKRGNFFSYTRYGFYNLHSIPLLGISIESRGTLIKTLAWNPRFCQSPLLLISSSGSSWLQHKAPTLSLTFAAGNIKKSTARASEKFELDLTCGKVYMKPLRKTNLGVSQAFNTWPLCKGDNKTEDN